MKEVKLSYTKDFNVLTGNDHSQSAVMVIAPGDSEGGEDNKHDNSDQWLYVISGVGKAKINAEEVDLYPDSLILIERGEIHQITNTGENNLLTLNFYVPPAY